MFGILVKGDHTSVDCHHLLVVWFGYILVFRIRIQSGQWIRIRIQGAKHDPQKYKKVKKFHVLK